MEWGTETQVRSEGLHEYSSSRHGRYAGTLSATAGSAGTGAGIGVA